MAFLIYNLALLILSPAIALYVLYRVLVSGKSRKAWRQQLGGVALPRELNGRDRVWIHAVSVGESVASAAVVSGLKKSLPDVSVIVSTTTQTGQKMARKSIEDADAFIFYPFDLLPAVWRSLRRVRPVVFASTDTEIWPNFRLVARRLGVKNAIINGTVSDKTISGAIWVPWIYRWTLANIDRFCMQTQADADRIISLGAEPGRVTVMGNIKADQCGNPIDVAEKSRIRSWFKLPDNARVFVAGSTNPGEDGPVIDAFIAARRAHPELKLVIAPRQIERREEIAGLARDKSLTCGWRSEPESITGAEDVFILDTFGELARVYAIADVTFVGGSFIPKGCHSILQPIAQGKPVFFGPYTFKAKDLVAQAKAAGVGFEARDGADLGRRIDGILGDRAALDDVRLRCEELMRENQGAAKRTVDALVELYNERGR